MLFRALLGALALHAACARRVYQLNDDNFASEVQREHQTFYVLFHDGEKQGKLSQEWDKAARQLHGYARVGEVSCAEGGAAEALCAQHGGSSLPSVVEFRNGQPDPEAYDGARTAKALLAHAQAAIPALTTTVDKKGFKKFAKAGGKGMPKALVFVKSIKDAAPMFSAMAARYEGRVKMALVSAKQKKLARRFDVGEFPSVVVLPALEEDDDDDQADNAIGLFPDRKGRLKMAALDAFMALHALPGEHPPPAPVEEVTDPSCLRALCTDRGGLCALLVLSRHPTDPRRTHHYLELLAQAADTRRDGTFSFAWVDAAQQAEWLEQSFGILPADHPQLLVLSPAKLKFAPFVGSFSVDGISSFLSSMKKGGVATSPVLVSPLPEPAGDTARCEGMQVASAKQQTTTRQQQQQQQRQQAGEEVPEVPRLKRVGGKRGRSHTLDPQLLDTVAAGSHSHWLVLYTHGAEVPEAWSKAARSLNNMVNFGVLDAQEHEDAAKEQGLSLAAGESAVLVYGSDPATPPTRYEGAMTLDALSSFAIARVQDDKLADRLVTHIKAPQQLEAWLQVYPNMPRVLLFSDKAKEGKVPALLKALQLEYFGYVQFGVTGMDSGLAEQFQVTKAPSFALVQAAPVPEDANKPPAQQRYQLQAQPLPVQPQFNAIARVLDQTRLRFPYSPEGEPTQRYDVYPNGQAPPSHDEL